MEEAPPVPKLVRGRLKLRLALGAALALVVGYLLAPPAAREAPPEKVVPMLEAEVQRREPARVFRGVQDVGGKALAYAVSFPGPRRPELVRTHADFRGEPQEARPPAGLGVVVSKEGDVLTHARAIAGEFAPAAQLPGGGPLLPGRVVAYEPESGLVLVRLALGTAASPPALAAVAPQPGELAVAAARMDGRDFVAPVFVAAVAGDRYILSAASGVVVPGTPVFNLAGELVALAAGSPAVSVSWAAGPALARLAALRLGPRAVPRSLGLSLQTLDGPLAARLGESGVLVSDVAEGGPAARAGLRPGDVLEAIDGAELQGVRPAQDRIAGGGEELVLRLRRAGRVRELRVATRTVLEAPAAAPRAAEGPLARTLFAAAALESCGIGTEARLVSIEGTPVASEEEAARMLRRRRPPWLVYAQDGARRFFAVVAEPSP